MSRILSLLGSTLCLLLLPLGAEAATLYWVGTDGANTSVASNWKTTDPTTCGGGDSGAAPSSADTVIFDRDCDNGANINSALTVTAFTMQSGYTGTVTQATGIAVTISGGNFTQSGGTFTGGNSKIIISDGNFNLQSGTFTNTSESASGMTVDRNFTVAAGATFTNTGKKVTFDDNHTGGADDTTVTCTGTLGGTVVILKDAGANEFNVAAGCAISLGDSPTSKLGFGATSTNNGTITIPSGAWTFNTIATTPILVNAGTITHSGSGWTMRIHLTNNAGATMSYSGITIQFHRDFRQHGTFDLSGKLVVFPDDSSNDDSVVACTGSLGGTVAIRRDTDGDFKVATGCSINLGPSPSSGMEALGVNSGTIVIPSGTWTINQNSSTDSFTNYGTISHAGNGFDFNSVGGSFTNAAGGTISYSGTTINMEGSFTQNGTFDLTGKTLTFDGTAATDDTTLTCGSVLSGSIVINKTDAGGLTTLGSNCTIAGSFTRTDGAFMNPSSAYTLTIQGALSMSTTDAFGGSNLSVAFTGSNNQTITQNAGTLSGSLTINKSSGIVSLATNVTTGSANTCTIAEGTLDLYGKNFTCGSTFTVEDGGIFRLEGGETVTTPTLNNGSTVWYDDPGGTTTLKSYSHKNLIIGSSGSTVFHLPASTLDVNGSLTLSGGTLTITNAQVVTVTGSWLQVGNGSFSAGTGTVILDGRDQLIDGTTTFYNLTKTGSTARTLTFGAGDTQTISNTLVLQGAASNLMSLRSSTTGTQWRFNPQGTRTLAYLDVKDSNNTNATAITATDGTFTDSGNNTNWTFTISTTEDTTAQTQTGGGGGGGGRRIVPDGTYAKRIDDAHRHLIARFLDALTDSKLAKKEESKSASSQSSVTHKGRLSSSSSSAPNVDLPDIATRRGKLLVTIEETDVLYSDVDTDAWYAPYVATIISEGIAQGYKDETGKLKGEFGVGNPVTRAEVLKMALESAGKKPSGSPRNTSAKGTWAAPYVATAEALQISVFTPEMDVHAPATRGEVLQIILEVGEFPTNITIPSPFTDVPADHPYVKAITTAFAFGIVQGDTDASGKVLNRFRPDDSIVRAEVSKIIALVKEAF